jgi:hypothetical protein
MGEAKKRRDAAAKMGVPGAYVPRNFVGRHIEAKPGFKLDEDGNGYSYDEPDGRVQVRGATVFDQMFMSEKYGKLNITRIQQRIRRLGIQPILSALTPDLRNHVAKVEIDENYVRTMTIATRDQPVIGLVASDGVNIIDGHHRLARRFADGLEQYQIYILPPVAMVEFQVQYLKENIYGGMIEIGGVDPDHMEAEVMAGMRVWEGLKAQHGAPFAWY